MGVSSHVIRRPIQNVHTTSRHVQMHHPIIFRISVETISTPQEVPRISSLESIVLSHSSSSMMDVSSLILHQASKNKKTTERWFFYGFVSFSEFPRKRLHYGMMWYFLFWGRFLCFFGAINRLLFRVVCHSCMEFQRTRTSCC